MTDMPALEAARRRSAVLVLVGLGLLAVLYARALVFTPLEATQGAAQKIFYVHVPSAWVAFMAFGLVGVCSVLYLVMRDQRIDRLAAALTEVGVVFTTGVLITGPIWARPIWGAWWTWDARLTSTLFLWFIAFGYLMLRATISEPGLRARSAAVLGILGALMVPFIHVSVYLFRTLHPMPVVLKPGRPSLPGSMLATLFLGLAVMTVLFAGLVWQRYAQAALADARAEREAGHA